MPAGNRRERRAAQAREPRPVRASPAGPGLAQALALERDGRLGEAFNAYWTLVHGQASSPMVRQQFGRFLAVNTPAHPHPDIDLVLRAALEEPWLRPDALVQPIVRYLTAKHAALADPLREASPACLQSPSILALIGDPLLLALLKATPAATPALDILLARLRHSTLMAATEDADLEQLFPFLAALAERAVNGDFALTLPATLTDKEAIHREPLLVQALRAQCHDASVDPARLALLGSFERLAPALLEATSDARLRGVHAAHVTALAIETEIAQALRPASRIEAETAPVRDQYEAFPYPRWAREPAATPLPLPPGVERTLRRRYPTSQRVLVAGCGTGQHALTAARRWPGAEVTAIDCSRQSLAHAIRKSREAGLGQLSFALCDLLHADALGERFEVIEAVGVLHHLADPLAGLKALKRALAPGGAVLAGLYSRAARAHLDDARHLAGGQTCRTGEALRQFRAKALAELDRTEILYSPDFYSLGGVRDLVFHERECSYDLTEVVALIRAAGLRPIALEPPAAAAAMSPPPADDDFQGWARAEQKQGLLFGSMYHVWAVSDA